MLLFCISFLLPDKVMAQCGADIYVLNDNSGSVDAVELQQSKRFITRLAIEMAPLGTGNNQTRIAISNFATTGTFTEFNFPIANSRYTTELADIIHYENSPRVLSGGTDVTDATYQASLVAGQPVIPGRNVAQILVILTDAYNYQVAPSIVQFAENLKAQGFFIVVMAIDEAVNIPDLQQVASAGGYFTAGDYQALENNVITYAQNLATQTCTYVPPTPKPDLNIALTNFNIINCLTTPTSSVSYQVNNVGNANFSGNLYISLYDADPRIPGANLLGVRNAGAITIAAGSSASGTITNTQIAGLNSATNLYAVVNFRGDLAGNQVPVSAQLSQSQLATTIPVAETITTNNFSSGAIVNLGAGCNTAILDMSVTSTGGGCEDEVTYTIQVCNNGVVDASLDDLLVAPAPGFSFVSGNGFCSGVSISFSQLGQDLIGNATNVGQYKSELSADGTTMIVSSISESNGGITTAGAVRVYDYNTASGQWVQRGQTIFGQSAAEQLGTSIDISADGNRIVVLSRYGTAPRGKAVVYDWNSGTGQWQVVGNVINNLIPSNNEYSDVALSDNGQRLVVSRLESGIVNVLVEVYELSGGVWTQKGATISGSYSDYFTHTSFGKAMDISADGSRIFLGGYRLNSNGLTDNGQVQIYNWNGSSWVATPFINGQSNNENLGWNVSASEDGNTFATVSYNNGAGYTAKIFTWNGASWIQKGSTISGGNMRNIALSGNGNRFLSNNIYEYDGVNWTIIESMGANSYGSINSEGNVVSVGNGSYNSSAGLVQVFSEDACTIAPGACKTVNYVYNVSGASAGTYDFDVVLTASKTNAAHANPIINPDKNFITQNSVTTGDGWDGSKHAEENVTIFDATFCSTTHTMGIALTLSPTAVCTGSFTTATVTITNPYPISIIGTDLVLNLGNGATYASEPYNRSGIVMPTFPGLNGTTGSNTIPVYTLAPGTNTFDIDIAVANGVTTLAAQLTAIDPAYNNGTATTIQVNDNVTGQTNPTITGTCPAALTFGTTSINLNYSVTGAATMLWTSGTNGTFSSPNSGTTSYTINPQDQANGFVDFTLMAASAAGCDNVSFCRISINDVPRDYGDAPISYDLGASTIPVAAAHSITPGLRLGILTPDTELQNQPSVSADAELTDDGLLIASLYIPAGATSFSLPVSVTNTTASIGYANAFIDWNENGDFLDENEDGTIVLVPANSGTSTYHIDFAIPAGITPPLNTYIRLRVSFDSAGVRRSFGAAAGGEVEDFYVLASVPVTGTVFNDINTNTIIEGTEEGTTAGTDLYVYLVNASGIIIDSAKVATNGSYQLNAAPGGSYTLHLSEVEYGLGNNTNTIPINTNPPNGWTTTGENGAGNTGPGDGTPDGILAVSVSTTTASQQNFGIKETTPLPVTLLSFTANKSGPDALLQWITVKEGNNSGFVVENSEDGLQWLPLGFVPMKKAEGNNHVYYDFNHPEPGAGKQYYRLKQVDLDGKEHYSSVRSLNFEHRQALNVYPNPAKEKVTVTGLKGYDKLHIYEMTGRLVTTITLQGRDVLEISLHNYSGGVYNLRVSDRQGRVQSFRVVKD